MISKRQFLATGVGMVVAPVAAEAQQLARVSRIGFLTAARLSSITLRTKAFRQELRELGYVDGRNMVIEYRWAAGREERLRDRSARYPALDMKASDSGEFAQVARH